MLSLLKNWSRGGCVQEGIDKIDNVLRALRIENDSNSGSSHFWSLGNPIRFFTQIYDFWGQATGYANPVAKVVYLDVNDRVVDLGLINLDNPLDILGVVDVLNKRFANEDSDEANVWREVMANYEKEKAEAASKPTRYRVLDPVDSRIGDMPDFLEEIFDDWRHIKVSDDTPDQLIEAFLRFGRAWGAWYSVNGHMFGGIYGEHCKRWDDVGFIIDRKVHNTKDIDYAVKMMDFYRLLMPGMLGMDFDDAKKEVEYERNWNKYVAADIFNSKQPLTYDRANHLLRTREVNDRLPSVISKYIKSEIPKFLKEEKSKLDLTSEENLAENLKRRIKWFDLNQQWKSMSKKGSMRLTAEEKSILDSIVKDIEGIEDTEILYLFSQLLSADYGESVNKGDIEKFYGRIDERMKKIERTQDNQPSLVKDGNQKGIDSLSEAFTLGAMALEHIFNKEQEIDIYSHSYQQFEEGLMEEDWW